MGGGLRQIKHLPESEMRKRNINILFFNKSSKKLKTISAYSEGTDLIC
jgi:hypothetical protein